jgi:hypothetical protein
MVPVPETVRVKGPEIWLPRAQAAVEELVRPGWSSGAPL